MWLRCVFPRYYFSSAVGPLLGGQISHNIGHVIRCVDPKKKKKKHPYPPPLPSQQGFPFLQRMPRNVYRLTRYPGTVPFPSAPSHAVHPYLFRIATADARGAGATAASCRPSSRSSSSPTSSWWCSCKHPFWPTLHPFEGRVLRPGIGYRARALFSPSEHAQTWVLHVLK